MFPSTVGSTMTVYAKTSYSRRAKKAKASLRKKMRKMLKNAGYYQPACGIESSKRRGKTLTCNLTCGIGEGACVFRVKVNLKTGVATIVYDPEQIFTDEDEGRWTYKFKVKVK